MMGVNKQDDDGSGDAWDRDSRPERQGNFNGINYFGIAIIIIAIILYFAAT